MTLDPEFHFLEWLTHPARAHNVFATFSQLQEGICMTLDPEFHLLELAHSHCACMLIMLTTFSC